MKLNATRRTLAFVLAILMVLGVAAVAFSVVADAAVTNYAAGCSYTTTSTSFLSGKADDGKLLTDGNVATEETNGVTVAFAGTGKTHTIVFDLGEVKYDIKTIKVRNVLVSGNRDFGAEESSIAVTKNNDKNDPVTNTYTCETELQSGTAYMDFIYTLSTEAIGRYVYVNLYSPNYVLSLSEIEIWGSGNPAVEDEEPVIINYALKNNYSASSSNYLSGFEDTASQLTDGVVADEETQGVTVIYAGTGATHTFIFDLGAPRDDIKTIKFRGVRVYGSRDFGAEEVTIACADTLDSAEPTLCEYTMVDEVLNNAQYHDYTYTLNADAYGQYVYITVYSPLYAVSLSEIEIWGSGANSGSSIIIPDPIDPEPKFDIDLSSSGEFVEGGNFELLCTINNISATYGIVGVDFIVSYNKAAFTPANPSGSDLSDKYIKTATDWEDVGTYCDTASGKVYMRFAHKEAENGDGVKEDGKLVFKIIFKANVSSGTYEFTASNCVGTDPGSSNYKKLTEVNANGSSCSATAIIPAEGLTPIDSKITVKDGYIFGVKPGCSSEELAAMFEGTVTVTENGTSEIVGTGYVVSSGESAVVVCFGDVDGTGTIDTTDYISVKKSFLKQLTLEGAYAKAADVDSSGSVDSTDYIAIKSHFVGKSSLY